MKGYNKIRKEILGILHTKLPKGLYYHGLHHTLDVLKVCNQYIKRGNFDDHTSKILRLGALLHDIGFTVSINDHELRGTEIAEELMTKYDFSGKDIDRVKGIIMATRVPQNPLNFLEEMICDADLDYLGRIDFYAISNQLFKELKFNSVLSTKLEWNKIQIKFLGAHKFHTDFAKRNRQPEMEKRIEEIKILIEK